MDTHQNTSLPVAAVLFDMDGTLVDSTLVVERQWTRFAARYGLDIEQILKISHGRRTEETLLDINPALATPGILADFDRAELDDFDGVYAVEGGIALVNALPLDAWAVVTSANRELAEARLQKAGYPIPDCLISADDVQRGKPDPQGYLLAAERLRVPADRCLVFEDTVPGLQAAYAAGMPAIAISTTFPCHELGADQCVANFATVLTWLPDLVKNSRIEGGCLSTLNPHAG